MFMKKEILLTGASGRLGGAVAEALLKTGNFGLRLLLRDKPLNRALAARLIALYGDKVEILYGDVISAGNCEDAIEDVNYVMHFAGVIPPKACHNPDACERTNYFGTKNLVDAIVKSGRSDIVRFVEIGSVTEYGNRNYLHPWARVGDPLIPSYYDCYAITKIRAERYVVESGLRYWTALRVAGVLHDNIVRDNMSDGLFLQTPPNAPMEMVLIDDMVTLFKNLLLYDQNGTLDRDFWRKIYNVGGGADARFTGYELFQKGFALISARADKLIDPQWLPVRNYYTSWYADGENINRHLHFQNGGVDDFFNKLYNAHAAFRLAKPLTPVIKKFIKAKIADTTNSPYYWVDNGMTDRVNAFFGGYDAWGKIPRKWNRYPLLINDKALDIDFNEVDVDYAALKNIDNAENYYLDHGFDDEKPDDTLDIDDCKKAAEFRGGKCLSGSMRKGNMHTVMNWECAEGHRFRATAYGVLRAGYWCNDCCSPAPWKFDEVAKKSPYYAQIWYDSHKRGEDIIMTAECYRDIPREDSADNELKKEKIKKYRKG